MDHKALIAPFDPYFIKWKAQTTSGERALAVAYIDARAVMDRLDEAVGPDNWQDFYQETQLGVICTISIRREDGEWVAKSDIGQTAGSGFTDPGKTGYSDAFKRAAVKWGVGRYLYRLPAKWVGYDPQRKRLTETPKLPDWALPRSEAVPDVGYQGEPEELIEAEIEHTQLKPRTDLTGVGKDPAELIAQGKAAMAEQPDESPAESTEQDYDLTPPTDWAEFWRRVVSDLRFTHKNHALNAYKQIFPHATAKNPPALDDAWALMVQHQQNAGRL